MVAHSQPCCKMQMLLQILRAQSPLTPVLHLRALGGGSLGLRIATEEEGSWRDSVCSEQFGLLETIVCFETVTICLVTLETGNPAQYITVV